MTRIGTKDGLWLLRSQMAQQREEGLGFLASYYCSIDSWAPSKLSKEGCII